MREQKSRKETEKHHEHKTKIEKWNSKLF